jgi:hypothetical protein
MRLAVKQAAWFAPREPRFDVRFGVRLGVRFGARCSVRFGARRMPMAQECA